MVYLFISGQKDNYPWLIITSLLLWLHSQYLQSKVLHSGSLTSFFFIIIVLEMSIYEDKRVNLLVRIYDLLFWWLQLARFPFWSGLYFMCFYFKVEKIPSGRSHSRLTNILATPLENYIKNNDNYFIKFYITMCQFHMCTLLIYNKSIGQL